MSDNKNIAFFLVAIVTGCFGFIVGLKVQEESSEKEITSEVTCVMLTPSGPIGTIKLEFKDVKVSNFGVITHKEGMYIPATNELCEIKKKD